MQAQLFFSTLETYACQSINKATNQMLPKITVAELVTTQIMNYSTGKPSLASFIFKI